VAALVHRYRVVRFSGFAIRAGGLGSPVVSTDLHVVDERGRTVRVFPAGTPIKERARQARWAALVLNGGLARVHVTPARVVVTCSRCRRTSWRRRRRAADRREGHA
jgi:hypothetical protein